MNTLLKKLRDFLVNHPDDKKYLYNKLDEMDSKIMHIEDVLADERDIMIRMVKQGNSIVSFLKDLTIPGIEQSMGLVVDSKDEATSNAFKGKDEKQQFFEDLAKEFETKVKKLSELEKELRKYKDQITPGQMGES